MKVSEYLLSDTYATSRFVLTLFSMSVVADEDGVQLYAMEMTFINKLFDTEPGLAMRFYCKVAQTLAQVTHLLTQCLCAACVSVQACVFVCCVARVCVCAWLV